MSEKHLELLIKSIESNSWIIQTNYDFDTYCDKWIISRPNGDNRLELNFTIGGTGNYGAVMGTESLKNAIGCHNNDNPKLDLYFGNLKGQYLKDLKEFIKELNQTSTTNIKTFEINGKNILTLSKFMDELCNTFQFQERLTTKNWDKLNDMLYGGFGILDYQVKYKLTWNNSSHSQKALSKDEFQKCFQLLDNNPNIILKLK